MYSFTKVSPFKVKGYFSVHCYSQSLNVFYWWTMTSRSLQCLLFHYPPKSTLSSFDDDCFFAHLLDTNSTCKNDKGFSFLLRGIRKSTDMAQK
ncbi:hypothetical protein Gasu2_45360 [Galdieria sulphuraria]|nr:hypothetical protein Gasu2_45360 [Galdieria sulphuraria]